MPSGILSGEDGVTTYRIRVLHELIGGLKETSAIRSLARDLAARLQKSRAPYEGAPVPPELVEGRLPAGILSAWLFVLPPEKATPPHRHPGSVQHSAAIQGGGWGWVAGRRFELQPYDPAFPEKSLLVIPENAPHAFQPGHEGLVLMSFHTVKAEELREIPVEVGEEPLEIAPSPPRAGKARGPVRPEGRGGQGLRRPPNKGRRR